MPFTRKLFGRKQIYPPENDTSRLDTPLEAERINKLVVNSAAIKSLVQPYVSFEGRPKENEVGFRRRVSERLRHKGRAVTLFDHERMVLQQFPQIYKVKCLPHTRTVKENEFSTEETLITNAPGHVTLVVIPDITRFSIAEKLRPKASRSLLESIQLFLAERATPFMKMHVVNPRYQGISVSGKIAFIQGKDRLFYEKQLTQAILEFMTPWAFGELDRLSFGGRVYKSSILHHIERLPYVDYVIDFAIESEGKILEDDSVIEADSEHSILAYHTDDTDAWLVPAAKDGSDFNENKGKGIGYHAIPFLIGEEGDASEKPKENTI